MDGTKGLVNTIRKMEELFDKISPNLLMFSEPTFSTEIPIKLGFSQKTYEQLKSVVN